MPAPDLAARPLPPLDPPDLPDDLTVPCPACAHALAPEAVACPRCGAADPVGRALGGELRARGARPRAWPLAAAYFAVLMAVSGAMAAADWWRDRAAGRANPEGQDGGRAAAA